MGEGGGLVRGLYRPPPPQLKARLPQVCIAGVPLQITRESMDQVAAAEAADQEVQGSEAVSRHNKKVRIMQEQMESRQQQQRRQEQELEAEMQALEREAEKELARARGEAKAQAAFQSLSLQKEGSERVEKGGE